MKLLPAAVAAALGPAVFPDANNMNSSTTPQMRGPVHTLRDWVAGLKQRGSYIGAT